MNLRSLDEKIDFYHQEAQLLSVALEYYLQVLVVRSGEAPLPFDMAMSIKPVSQVHKRLQQLLRGQWPPARPGRSAKPRRLRLEYDELLQLNHLYQVGKLAPATYMSPQFAVAMGKINQKAQNLTPLFNLR